MVFSFTALLGFVIVLGVLLLPGVRNNAMWRASMTPLASIIGSGFLIIGPILASSFGWIAPIAMIILCGFAYAIGGAIRYNISVLERYHAHPGRIAPQLEHISGWCLTLAYLISVTYYLALFGAFFARSLPATTQELDSLPALISSFAFALILGIGLWRGFDLFEKFETVTVGLKLIIIGGLLLSLALYFASISVQQGLVIASPSTSALGAVTLCFGLVITTQGFETSRYLGEDYSAEMRRSSMRLAQWVSTIIYVIYVVLLTYALPVGHTPVEETEIIDLMAVVAPVLPAALIIAALSAQFSAAIADTSGFGGLLTDLSHGRIRPKLGYGILGLGGLIITWQFNVFEIVAIASRAFSIYYAAQTGLAAINARNEKRPVALVIYYSALSLVCLAAALLGTSFETGP